MRLSTKGRYGLQAMYELGKNYGQEPLPLSEIAKVTELPIGYLEQLIRKLKKDDLVDSTRGPKGGYFLKRAPKDITIGDILRSLEDFFGVTECSNENGVCGKENSCPSRKVWIAIADEINKKIDSMTLQDMVDGNIKRTR